MRRFAAGDATAAARPFSSGLNAKAHSFAAYTPRPKRKASPARRGKNQDDPKKYRSIEYLNTQVLKADHFPRLPRGAIV